MNVDNQLIEDAALALSKANLRIKELMLSLEDSLEQIVKRDAQIKNLTLSLEAANTHISEQETQIKGMCEQEMKMAEEIGRLAHPELVDKS